MNSNGKRRNIRFKPDMQSIAQLDTNPDHGTQNFRVVHNALIIDESYTGCGLVIISDNSINEGDIITAKIGNLGPLKCEVIWVKALDEKIDKIGLRYLD